MRYCMFKHTLSSTFQHSDQGPCLSIDPSIYPFLYPFIHLYIYICIYSVFFFIEPKIFVNLTYLHLSEIKKQGLIFSVGMGHLKICKKDFRSRQSIFILTGFSPLCMQSVCRVMNWQMVSKLLNLTLFFSLLH